MSEEKTKVTVDIYGMQYKIAGQASGGHMRRVAELVDAQMNKIAKGFPKLDTPKLAVLAAVNIADEFLKMKEQLDSKTMGIQSNMAEEHKELASKYNALTNEHQLKLAELKEAEQREAELTVQMQKLQEEYTKLQTEYNEWIELVQTEPDDAK